MSIDWYFCFIVFGEELFGFRRVYSPDLRTGILEVRTDADRLIGIIGELTADFGARLGRLFCLFTIGAGRLLRCTVFVATGAGNDFFSKSNLSIQRVTCASNSASSGTGEIICTTDSVAKA